MRKNVLDTEIKILVVLILFFAMFGLRLPRSGGGIYGIELFRTPLYHDPHLLAYYRLEDNLDSKKKYDLTDESGDGVPTFVPAQFNNGSNTGNIWQKSIGRYNANFALSTGTMPLSISAWVSINSQPPQGLDGDFVVVPLTNRTVDYALGYGWFHGRKQIFFSRARLGIVAERALYPLTMTPSVFYHLVGTWDGAGNLILYINGERVVSLSYVSLEDGTGSHAAGLGINGTWSSTDTIQGGMGGIVDDVAIFDRVLTPHDIRLLEQ